MRATCTQPFGLNPTHATCLPIFKTSVSRRMLRGIYLILVALISLLALVGAQHALPAMVARRDDDPIVPGHSNFPLRILPLGASITWGQKSSDGNGYRGHLRDMLQKRSTVVDMVGTMKSGNMPDNVSTQCSFQLHDTKLTSLGQRRTSGRAT